MVRDITDLALELIARGAKYQTECTITPPGGEPTTVRTEAGWSVTEKGQTGPRLGVSSLKLLPTPGVDDLFALAKYAGSVYNLRIGVSRNIDVEWVNVFRGYVIDPTSSRASLGTGVSLSDPWQYCDKVSFDGEYATTVGVSRANSVAEIFTPVVAGMTTLIEANGGYIATAAVYTGSRAQAATAIARDGLLLAGFNGNGELVIKNQPDLSGNLTPDWRFRTDQSNALAIPAPLADLPTIVEGSLERTEISIDGSYNAVIVSPGGPDQTWTKQTARLADTTDPRHQDYVGFRPFPITSDTIDNECDALLLAQVTLTRLLRGTDKRVRLNVLLNPAIESDDIFWTAALPTLDDAGWNDTFIATSVTHSPKDAITSLEGISAAGYILSSE